VSLPISMANVDRAAGHLHANMTGLT